jgi:hypothetical protein
MYPNMLSQPVCLGPAEAHRTQLSVVIKLRSDSPRMKKELTLSQLFLSAS